MFLFGSVLLLACNKEEVAIDLNQFKFNVPSSKKNTDDPLLKLVDGKHYYQDQLYSGMIETPNSSEAKRIYSILDGVEHGKQIGWHTNKNLSFKYFCIHGKRHGEYLEYYPVGKMQIRAEYNLGEELSRTIWDLNDQTIVNYVIKDGRYYGLLGSSDCLSVFNADKTKASLKE